MRPPLRTSRVLSRAFLSLLLHLQGGKILQSLPPMNLGLHQGQERHGQQRKLPHHPLPEDKLAAPPLQSCLQAYVLTLQRLQELDKETQLGQTARCPAPERSSSPGVFDQSVLPSILPTEGCPKGCIREKTQDKEAFWAIPCNFGKLVGDGDLGIGQDLKKEGQGQVRRWPLHLLSSAKPASPALTVGLYRQNNPQALATAS